MDTDRKTRIYADFLFCGAGIIALIFYFTYPFELSSGFIAIYNIAIIYSIALIIVGVSLITLDLIFKRQFVIQDIHRTIWIITLPLGFVQLILFIIFPNTAIILFLMGVLFIEVGMFYFVFYIRHRFLDKTTQN